MNKVLRNTVMGVAAGLMLLATPAVAHAQGAGRAETAAAHPNQTAGGLGQAIGDLLNDVGTLVDDLLAGDHL